MLAWSSAPLRRMGCGASFRPSSLELMRGDTLRVDVVDGPNWRPALELLRDGHVIVYQGVGLQLADFSEPGRVTVGPLTPLTARIATQWELGNLTKSRALTDLTTGQAIVQALIADSSDVRELVEDRGLRYELIDDYDTGAILLATLSSGVIEWHRTRWMAG
jgi:hypothetical protein